MESGEMLSKKYDIFISYKTTNANEAREIAEFLIGNGLSVCFAEYEIPLESWEDINTINEFIDKSIKSSLHALVLANDEWTRSDFCKKEINNILAVIPINDIAVIHIPLEEGYMSIPNLDDAKQMEHRGEIIEIMDFINDLEWFSEPLEYRFLSPTLVNNSLPIKYIYGVSVKTGPIAPYYLWPIHIRSYGQGGCYHYMDRIEDQIIHISIMIYPYNTPLTNYVENHHYDQNDQIQTYRAAIGYAKEWTGNSNQEVKGVHIFFANNKSHFALTAINEGKIGDKSVWVRRYAILLENGKRAPVEADVVFYCNLHSEDEHVAIQKLSRLTPYFDAVVHSLNFSHSRNLISESILAITSKILILFLALQLYGHDIVQSSIDARYFASFIFGILIADFVASIFIERHRIDTNAKGLLSYYRVDILPMIIPHINRLLTVIAGSIAQVISIFVESIRRSFVLAIAFVAIFYCKRWDFSIIAAILYTYGIFVRYYIKKSNISRS